MSGRRENYYGGGSSSDIVSWVVVFICLVAFWPVGLFLLLRKISFGAKGKDFSAGNYGERYKQKYEHYRQRAQSRYNRYAERYGFYQQGGPQKPWQTGGSQTGGTAPGGGTAQGNGQQSSSAGLQKPYQSQRSAGQSYYAASQGQSPGQSASGDKSSPTAAASEAGTVKGGPADKKKNPAKSLALALTALSIVLAILGVVFLSSGLGGIAAAGVAATSLGMTIFGGFSLLGALITTLLRGGVLRQVRRFTKYAAVIGDRDVVSVTELAKAVGEPVKKTRKCLEEMLDSGYYGETAYIDSGLDSFVTSREAADKARGTSAGEEGAAKPVGTENQYVAIVNELHMLCGQTSDPAICAKIERIETLTVKIFRIVEEAPEKAPQLRRFMNYYLPTTLKLLHSYQTLERQGIDGENITAAKQDIERILDTLAAGFEQQLDNLFKSDKLDISADIDVIENLMEQDGLSGDGGIMRTAGGH